MCFHSVCIVIICLINCTLQFITLGLIVYLVYYRHSDLGFPDSLVGKKSACNAGDLGLIPGLGRSPGEGKGYPLQCSGLEKSVDCIVHGVAKSRTPLSDFHFLLSDTQIVLKWACF